ncbi:hypothetical protein WDU94_014055 [Cyamophila willieti]
MCLTFCMVIHDPDARSDIIYKYSRIKVAIASLLVGLMVSGLMFFLANSYHNKDPVWSVYPVQKDILIQLQMYLLFFILISMIMMFVATLVFRFFVFVFIAISLFSLACPLLSLLFLVHLFFKFHWFYVLAAKVTCETSMLFIYFYQGFEKMIKDAMNEA